MKDVERQARSRQSREDAGGKQVAVMLTPQAASKLGAWIKLGETIASIINKLLTRSRP